MTYAQLLGFGEAMLRMSVPPGASLETTDSFDVTVGGAELNALIAAARAGMPSTWVSALPDGALGRRVSRHARANGVEVRPVPATGAGGTRLGAYFLELATFPRPPRIIYDRAGSTFSCIEASSIPWRQWLDAETCLLVSGITPPLGDGPSAALDSAVTAARACGATVALDVNYRSALWSREDAGRWLQKLLPEVDILSAGRSDLASAGLEGGDPLADAVEAFGMRAGIETHKQQHGSVVELHLRVVVPDSEERREAEAVVVDPVGAGDALFGTFVATLPTSGPAAAADAAIGAAVSCYGLRGDALTTDAWDASDTRSIVR